MVKWLCPSDKIPVSTDELMQKKIIFYKYNTNIILKNGFAILTHEILHMAVT